MPQSPNPGSGSVVPVGNGERVVRAGECVISIAAEVGHFWETLWNDPANSEVKKRRGAPHVLLEGDRLHVPPLRLKTFSGGTEVRHRFRRKGIPVSFAITLEENEKPLAGFGYRLVVDGAILKRGVTPKDGKIEASIPPGARVGQLIVTVNSIDRVYDLGFGELDPPQTVSGAVGRLQNLGYAVVDDDEESFALALRQFQKDNGLTTSGELDEQTAAKLADVHGS